MLKALGVKLLKEDGTEIEPGPLGLKELNKIDTAEIAPRLKEVSIIVACAVENPLTGPTGTSMIFGPKKGATNRLIPELDDALGRFHKVAHDLTGRDVECKQGAGAAGGVGAALMQFTESEFKKGIDVVLEEGKFKEKAQGASLIITGEGKTDLETVWWGKAPLGVSLAGRELNIPTITIAGSLEHGYQKLYDHGVAAVMSMLPYPMNYPQALRDGALFLEDAAWRLAKLLSVKFQVS
jgi:glycerate kinase